MTKIEKQHPATEESCFVIMPFRGWFDRYYTNIYQPAISEAGLNARRADDIYRSSNIVSDIWKLTNDASIILADLTGKNANVLYELGLAHAISKPAILIAADLDDIPFDLQSIRILQYDKNEPNWGTILKDGIKKAIQEVLSEPLASVPAPFIRTKPSLASPEITQHEKEILALRQDVDQLLSGARHGRVAINLDSLTQSAANTAQHLHNRGVDAQTILEVLSNLGIPRSNAALIVHSLSSQKLAEHWLYEPPPAVTIDEKISKTGKKKPK